MKISPCGRQTRCSSSSRRAGRSTTETTYIATTLSKLASGNVISSAFISSSASTFVSLRFSPGRAPYRASRRHVDAGDARMQRIKRQRQPGAHADLEHALARLAAERLDDGLAAGCRMGPNSAS